MANTFNHNGKVVINDSGQMSVNTTSVPYVDDKLLVSGGHIIIENNWSYLQYSSTGARVSIISLNNSNNISVGQSNVNHGSLNLYGGTGFVTINAGASEVARFTTAGNVGIGTTSPSEKLHVVGSTVTVGTSYLFSNTNASYYNSGGNALFHQFESYWDTNSASSIATYRFDVGTWRLWSLGTGSAVVTVKSNGNVGIGTTSPSEKLEVVGSIKASGGLYSDNGSLAGNIGLGQVTSITSSFTSYANLQFTMHNGGGFSDIMKLQGNGNVGIGTTSPNTKLEVFDGDISVTTGGTFSFLNLNRNFIPNSSGVLLGGTKFRGYSTGTTYQSGVHIYGYSTEAWTSTSSPGYLSIQTTPSGSTTPVERMVVTSAGNVGIGTTSPAGKLHIADDGPNALIIGDTQVSTIGETNNGGYPGMKIVPYNSNIHIGISSTTDNKINLWYGGQNYTYWQQLETYSVISNYSTSALVLQVNGGNVGIGTTSPSFRFDVAGAAGDWATRFTSNAGASAYFAHGGGYGGYIDAGSNASASTYLLSLVSNGSTRVYIKGNGDVGIGTTSSINNSLLSVGGGINTTTGIIGYNTADWFTLNGKTQPHYGFNLIPTSSSPIGISGYFGISLATEGSERIRILGNGNVGIGTTSPATKLHVVGYSRNDGGLLLNGSDADYREIIFTTSAASRWNLYAYGGESGSNAGSVLYLARYADNGDYIANVATFLRTNGYVGIATSTPTQQLHVSGNIRVTGAYYDSNNSAGSSGQVLSSTGSGTDWVSLSEITGVDGTGTANYVTKWQDANTVTDSVIYDNGTNVGIGTLPNQGVRLQVAGAVDAWSSLNTLLRLSHDGTRGKIQSYTGGGYSPTAINADGGNVLIGTDTDAGHLLYVNGTSRFNGVIHGSTRLMVGITSDQTYASIFVGGDITTGGSQYALLLDPQLSGTNNYGLLANARIKASHAATNAYGVYIVNNETLSGASIVNNYGLYIADQTRGSSVNYALYSAGGTSYFAGNVGIGTGSPSTKLEVGNFLDAVTNKITVAARYEYEPEFNFRLGQSGTNLDWIGSVISSGDDGNYNGKILFKTANAGRDTPTTKMVIKANGNVLIGTTTDGGYKLRVNGTGRYDDYLQLWSGTAGASPRLIFGGETSSTDKSIFLESYYMVFQGHNNEGFKFQTTSSLGAVTNRMSILGTGTVVLSNYGSGSKTGTVAYNLAVDASGNVIETAGGVVDGSGTANYVTKWQDANTVTDSQIRDDGTTVGVGTAPAAAKLTVDGALTAAGQTSYGKSYASLDTTGVAVAGLSSSSNGQSALFTFTCYGGDNHYQRVVYSCKNDSGTWYTSKVVDEGTNGLDVTASANGATITFTYKARSANQGYSPRILIDHLGSAINTSYL